MTTTFKIATPLDERITVLDYAKAYRVKIADLVAYLREALGEEWIDKNTTVEPVMAEAACAALRIRTATTLEELESA